MQFSVATIRNAAPLLSCRCRSPSIISAWSRPIGCFSPVSWRSGCWPIGSDADEQVAEHAGGAIGSLLNVSFGNAAELVLALFVLSQARDAGRAGADHRIDIGTTLLFLGIAVLVGGVRRERQTFSQAQVGLLSTLLLLLTVAILLPVTST